MEIILTSLAPFAVALVVQGLKKLRTIKISDYRATLLRVLGGLFSFGAVVISSMLSGGEVDIVEIETLVDTVFTFLSASGVYLLSKKSTV